MLSTPLLPSHLKTSRRMHRTKNGCWILPISVRMKAGCTWRSCLSFIQGGWWLGDRRTETATLVCDALIMSLWHRKMPTGVIVHSDWGSQYCSAAYKKLFRKYHLICSMGKKGDCYLCPVGMTMPPWKAETTVSKSKLSMVNASRPVLMPSFRCSNILKCITIEYGFTRN